MSGRVGDETNTQRGSRKGRYLLIFILLVHSPSTCDSHSYGRVDAGIHEFHLGFSQRCPGSCLNGHCCRKQQLGAGARRCAQTLFYVIQNVNHISKTQHRAYLFQEPPNCFIQQLYHFYFPISNVCGFQFLCILVDIF